MKKFDDEVFFATWKSLAVSSYRVWFDDTGPAGTHELSAPLDQVRWTELVLKPVWADIIFAVLAFAIAAYLYVELDSPWALGVGLGVGAPSLHRAFRYGGLYVSVGIGGRTISQRVLFASVKEVGYAREFVERLDERVAAARSGSRLAATIQTHQ